MAIVITPGVLTAIGTNFRALWEDQFLAAQNEDKLRDQLAMLVPSNTLVEDYSWLGTVPRMKEWIDQRQLQGIEPQHYSLKNRDWEDTIEVDRNTIEDDRLGIVRPRIVQLAQEAIRFQTEHTVDVLIAGNTATGLAYDGQRFFDTDHADPGAAYQTAQSNKLTGTGTTLLQLTADLDAARVAMRNFKDGNGRPMNLAPTHILVPPALESSFKIILNSEMFPGASGATVANPYRGMAELIVNGLLSDANDWYLLCLNQPVKPLIFQMRKEPVFTALDSPTDHNVFMSKKFYYGVDARFAAGYGFWQMAVITTNT